MTPLDIFLNRQGRLRSGWRLAIFCAAYSAVLAAFFATIGAIFFLFKVSNPSARLAGTLGYILQSFILFSSALLVGWGCGRLFEDLPLRALGWARHRGWLRDLVLGTVLGVLSLMVAALIATALGGFRFSLASSISNVAFVKTFFGSALIFVIAAAAEEMLFRGYPLQTMMRALPFLLAVIPSSVLFAYVHLDNPNVAVGFTFINTTLAGFWLAVAYLRTRSLWFPLGLHWAWNWAMGALLGLPVSGITSLTRAPLFRAADTGPAWLTGGAYGIEGGAACTVALIISTIFIWKTRLINASEELRMFTDGEIPKEATGDEGQVTS
ncbi:MAG TPA: type II CAAX endopeptidase family protein [Pyrinomonadaceae bacterium]|nr:type II CAAX endopeptidase family protein [Pyrinomonadaceae bacterium]